MAQCILGHVASISRDFVDSNRALPNLHGMSFVFHTASTHCGPPRLAASGPFIHCKRRVARCIPGAQISGAKTPVRANPKAVTPE